MIGYLAPLRALKFLFIKPHTVRVPDKVWPRWPDFADPREGKSVYRGVHDNDWTKCIGCGNCSRICPAMAIEMKEIPKEVLDEIGAKGVNKRPQIDYGRCTFCALCVDVCPSGSLTMTDNYAWVTKDARDHRYFFPGAEKWKYASGQVRTWHKNPQSDLLRPKPWVKKPPQPAGDIGK